MKPLVSILIPSYNAASWLEATVASVRAQTYRRCEIILVDDGSEDDSLAIARRLEGPDMRVISQPNAGQCAAFNTAFRLSQGDLIEYLDADDLLAPEKLEIQVNRLSELPEAWIASGAWARFSNVPAEAVFTPEPVWKDLSPVDWLTTSWAGGGMMHGAAWLIPRSLIEAAGPWDERLSLINDFDFYTRCLLASKGIAFCLQAKTYYRSGIAGSMSDRTSRLAWESAFLSTELGTSALLRFADTPEVRRAAAINWQRLVYAAYPDVPHLVKQGEARVRELGGADLKQGGGPAYTLVTQLFGWKAAQRGRNFVKHLRRRLKSG